MEDNQPILSICIPTYNGASSFLKEVLDTVTKVAVDNSIEVIVSNNCSNDNTSSLLTEYYSCPNFKYYENRTNLGFNKNMLLLTDSYAKGKYCWIIGDDDIIEKSSISFIIEILKKGEVDFISLRYNFSTIEEYKLCNAKNNNYSITYSTFAELIDANCLRGNTLSTYIGASIFNRNKFKNIPKEIITNSFDSYYNVFPNAYILVTAFHNSKCAYIQQQVVTIITRSKPWDTSYNWYMIDLKFIVDLFKYYESMGIGKKNIPATYKRILYDIIISGFKRLINCKKVYPIFYKSIIESFLYPSIQLLIFKTFLKKIGIYKKPINI